MTRAFSCIRLFSCITYGLLAAIAVAGGSASAPADDYPTRTIRAVVPFAPAGVMDLVARIVLERVGQSLGQQIVIDNRPGAGGTIAIDLVAHAPPDGYTIVIADPAGSLAASVSLYPKLNFDPVKDLSPIALLGTSGAVLSVSNALPAKTLQEFVAIAKSRPGELLFGSAGNGTPGHLNGELFKRLTGIDVVHVPYRVGSQAVTDLIAGRISFWISPIATVLPQIQAGLLKPIATTYNKRISAYPSLPTTAEQGYPTVEIGHWAGLLAPRGTPQPIIDKMNAELQAALKTPEVTEKLSPTGIEPAGGSVADFAAFIASERKRLGDIAVKAKMGEP